mmetsp:Transcript_39079/g.126324  ORF Transcript_39079/g.126324 Transcript_39079/m.126324 type:complete len:301 (+) Transcript_39079:218-1120(+)
MGSTLTTSFSSPSRQTCASASVRIGMARLAVPTRRTSSRPPRSRRSARTLPSPPRWPQRPPRGAWRTATTATGSQSGGRCGGCSRRASTCSPSTRTSPSSPRRTPTSTALSAALPSSPRSTQRVALQTSTSASSTSTMRPPAGRCTRSCSRWSGGSRLRSRCLRHRRCRTARCRASSGTRTSSTRPSSPPWRTTPSRCPTPPAGPFSAVESGRARTRRSCAGSETSSRRGGGERLRRRPACPSARRGTRTVRSTATGRSAVPLSAPTRLSGGRCPRSGSCLHRRGSSLRTTRSATGGRRV